MNIETSVFDAGNEGVLLCFDAFPGDVNDMGYEARMTPIDKPWHETPKEKCIILSLEALQDLHAQIEKVIAARLKTENGERTLLITITGELPVKQNVDERTLNELNKCTARGKLQMMEMAFMLHDHGKNITIRGKV